MDLLQTSAALMRSTIEPALGECISAIDKQIRLALGTCGPRYANLKSTGSTLQVRRVRYLYDAMSVADLIVREMVMGHAQVSGMRALLCLMVLYIYISLLFV